jgi:DnaJ-class molecular chaperone
MPQAICSPCNGNGTVTIKEIKKCSRCDGYGYERGSWNVFPTCPKCQGLGLEFNRIPTICAPCKGSGRISY